jgi:predicted TIM-barrel fold metal-dependent hydrolase
VATGSRACWAACMTFATAGVAAGRLPIIDMHLHAHTLDDYGGGGRVCTNDEPMEFPGVDPRNPITIEAVMRCTHPRASAKSDDAVMRESLAALERFNIYAVTSGALSQVDRWHAAAPARVIPAISFLADEKRTPEQLGELVAAQRVAVFAEIGAQYRGLSLDDSSLDPFFALAEKLDVPVGVHLGEGPPGGTHVGGYAEYRAALGHPLQLEPVMIRHPKLRLYVMHYGSPFVDEMIALMYSHPQVFVDVAQNDWGFPRAHFCSQLKRLVDAGFGKRILFGSDQMVWPSTIAVAIDTIEQAPFLSAGQKRDILYNNAARFLRWSPAELQQRSRQ